MFEGMFGQRLAEHFSLLESSSLALDRNRVVDFIFKNGKR